MKKLILLSLALSLAACSQDQTDAVLTTAKQINCDVVQVAPALNDAGAAIASGLAPESAPIAMTADKIADAADAAVAKTCVQPVAK